METVEYTEIRAPRERAPAEPLVVVGHALPRRDPRPTGATFAAYRGPVACDRDVAGAPPGDFRQPNCSMPRSTLGRPRTRTSRRRDTSRERRAASRSSPSSAGSAPSRDSAPGCVTWRPAGLPRLTSGLLRKRTSDRDLAPRTRTDRGARRATRPGGETRPGTTGCGSRSGTRRSRIPCTATRPTDAGAHGHSTSASRPPGQAPSGSPPGLRGAARRVDRPRARGADPDDDRSAVHRDPGLPPLRMGGGTPRRHRPGRRRRLPARLVSYIRQDETPHVEYLRTALTEMRDRTFVGTEGQRSLEKEVIGKIWDHSSSRLTRSASRRPGLLMWPRSSMRSRVVRTAGSARRVSLARRRRLTGSRP